MTEPQEGKVEFTPEDFEAFFGCCPGITGNKTTEEFIAEVRGDDDDKDARRRALGAEVEAWRECGEELEWCIYDTDKKEGFIRICPMCHGRYDKHREGCKLAERLGRK